MSTTLRRAATAASVLALAAVLAACNNGDGGSNGASGELDYEDSPLAAYYESFNVMGEMTQEEQQAFYDERTRQQEDLVAECMADQGFEYNPQSSGGVFVSSDDQDGPQWGTLEFAEQYGYGAFGWPGEDQIPEEDPEEWVDPNQEITESMSESELTAWQEALWGVQSEPEIDPETGEEIWEYNWEEGGCQGWAQHELEADDPWGGLMQLQEDPRFTELFAEMNDLYTDMQSDPRGKELNSEWAACMADEGYTFGEPTEAEQSIYDLSNSLWDEHDGTDTWEPDPDLVEEYKAQEISTAVADFTCREKIDYQQKQLEIQFEIEQEFVDSHKDALEEFAAAAQELQK